MVGNMLIPPGGTGGSAGKLGAIERMTSMAASDEIASMGKQLFPDDITLFMKSDLSEDLILALARASVIQRRTKSDTLNIYINDLLSFLVSKNRKGRRELIEMMAINKNMEEESGRL